MCTEYQKRYIKVSGLTASAKKRVVHGKTAAQQKVFFGETFSDAESIDKFVAIVFVDNWKWDNVRFFSIPQEKVLRLSIKNMTGERQLCLSLLVSHCLTLESL